MRRTAEEKVKCENTKKSTVCASRLKITHKHIFKMCCSLATGTAASCYRDEKLNRALKHFSTEYLFNKRATTTTTEKEGKVCEALDRARM